MHRRVLGYLVATALVLGACGTVAPGPAAPVALGSPAQPAPVGAPPAATAAATAAAGTPVALAAFMTMPLTDVRSGERFTFSDFKGKVTIIEGMAVW